MGSQNLHNRCLVAEVKGQANGLLSLSSDVDISLLHKCFELEPYHVTPRNAMPCHTMPCYATPRKHA